jgi:hypothetical protein
MDDRRMSEPKQPKPQKKPYKPPVLEKYGAVRDLTRATGTLGKNDSMSSNTSKTG